MTTRAVAARTSVVFGLRQPYIQLHQSRRHASPYMFPSHDGTIPGTILLTQLPNVWLCPQSITSPSQKHIQIDAPPPSPVDPRTLQNSHRNTPPRRKRSNNTSIFANSDGRTRPHLPPKTQNEIDSRAKRSENRYGTECLCVCQSQPPTPTIRPGNSVVLSHCLASHSSRNPLSIRRYA